MGDRLRDCVIGVDLASGSPQSKLNKPLYSAVVYCDGNYMKEWAKISLARLFRIAWEVKPSVIAVDSLQELAPSKRMLLKIGELLPPETGLVWINVDEEGHPKKLAEIASDYGMTKEGQKPSSLQTAYTIAYLAKKGLGKPVFAKNEITKLVIRRARVEGKGGMSSNRYKRKMRGLIKQLSKDVQSTLQKRGIDYEVYYKKSAGGFEKSVFIIYAPIDEVKKLISQQEFQDAVIELKPVVKLLLSDEAEGESPVIVGIDPGYNFGLAIIDIDGNVLFVDTIREASRAEITEIIRKYGKPVIVATDVYPVPESVRKLASNLRAKLFNPHERVEAALKREIANVYLNKQGISIRDSHSRDALAAAYLAFREVNKKLQETESYLRKTGLNLPLKKVQLKVLDGKSITDAVEEVIEEIISSEEERGPADNRTSERDESLKKLSRLVNELRMEKELLMEQLRKKDIELRRLEEELSKKIDRGYQATTNDRKVETLYSVLSTVSSKLRKIQEELQTEKTMQSYLIEKLSEISIKKKVAFPNCDTISRASSKKDGPDGVKVSYCFTDDLNAVSPELLSESGIRGVIAAGACEDNLWDFFLESGVGVLCDSSNSYSCESIGGNVIICDSKITAALEEAHERAYRAKVEREKAKILKLLMDYKETAKRREKSSS